MSLQTGQFKSQSIAESILKTFLSLFFSLITIILFIFVIGSLGFNYDINQIFKYTVAAQLPQSLSYSGMIVFLQNIALIIYWASPLILTALSVAIAFKAGLFNIGGQGQMIIGGLFGGIFAAVLIPNNFLAGIPVLELICPFINSSPVFMIPTIIVISMVFGAIWAGIPGVLRAYTGAHEVITTIFMNQIAINLANYLVGSNTSPFVDKTTKNANVYGQTATISPKAQILPVTVNIHLNVFGFHINYVLNNFSNYFNWSIFIIIIVVLITHYLIWNTNFGFKIRATGYNRTAAEVSGINTKHSIVWAMLLAGALAGLAGGFNVMAISPYKYIFGSEGTAGFDGIAVSLIGLNSPIPILPASFLFGFLQQAKILLGSSGTNISDHLVTILQSIVVIFAAAPYLSARFYKASKDLLRNDEKVMDKFKSWVLDNQQSLIVSSLFLIVPIVGILVFERLHIDIWTLAKLFEFLNNDRISLYLPAVFLVVTFLVLGFSVYKYTLEFVSNQKAKSTDMTRLVLKLGLMFVAFIEGFIIMLYLLVTISGAKVDIIKFHLDVFNVLISPVTIKGTIVAAFPIIMGAMGGTFNERSGVINIGLEGVMLMSAFGGVYFTYVTGNPYIGVLGGLLFGMLAALLHAVLTITLKAEQVVTGVGINLLALGLTDFLTTITWNALQSNAVNKLPILNLYAIGNAIHLPILYNYSIPIIGPILQILTLQSVLLFFGLLLIPICHIILFKTPFGLRLRVVGEEPSAAATAGISVKKYQYAGVLISGFLTSLGGVFLSIGDSQYFKSNMTGGRGFTALAAMIFGKWTILGSVLSGLFFGYFYELSITLQSPKMPYFSNVYRFLQMMPFIIAIMVLAGAIGLARPPKSIGKTYDPQD